MPGSSVDEERKPAFAVLGAGHGGLAMAGHLALMGFPTRLWNRSKEKIDHVEDRGGIDVMGVVDGFGRLECATSDIKEALDGANIIMVVVPASGHRFVAEHCAKHLKPEQRVVLNPGRTFGAMEFQQTIVEQGVRKLPTISEAQTFIYVSRHTDFASSHIMQIKNSVALAAIPAHRTPEVLREINRAFPQFVPASNVLETSLDNVGAVFHPTLTLLNATRIESSHGDFEYYLEGVTPSTARVLEQADAERVAVGNALGVRVHTAREWLYLSYDSPGKTLYEAIQATPGYKGVRAPATLTHRYILEDVPMSMIPIVSVGKLLDVPTPTITSLVHVASLLHSTDFWNEGRTAERVGLAGKTVKEIRRLATEGVRP